MPVLTDDGLKPHATAVPKKLAADLMVIGQWVDKSTGALNYNLYVSDKSGAIFVSSSKRGGFYPLDMTILKPSTERNGT